MKKQGILGVAASIILAACLLMGTASAVFAADQMTLSITPDKTAASVGETVNYTYVITNNSTDNISGITLSDNVLGPVTLSSVALLPGENATGTKSYIIKASDLPGPFSNTATALGTLSAGDNITTSATANVSINPLNSEIAVDKTADKSTAAVGDNITYTYTITNNGSSELTGLALTDSKFGDVALSVSSLAAGANTTAIWIYTVVDTDLPGPLTNTATATATDPSGAIVTADSDPVSVTLTSPGPVPGSAIRILKKADRQFAQVGDNITYTYSIKNVGSTALTALTLTDSRLGAIALSTTSLPAGASTTATRVYMVVEADMPGPLTNTATVIAATPSGATITATSNKVVVKLLEGRENWDGRTKGEILRDRGVPGKGIDNAPGLQKFFNPRSNAFDNAGKKDKELRELERERENNKNKNKNQNGKDD